MRRWGTVMGLLVLSLELQAEAAVSWVRVYQGPGDDEARATCPMADGGFAITGSTQTPGGGKDLLVVRSDAGGHVIWQTRFGSSKEDEGLAIQQTSDSGLIVSGATEWDSNSCPKIWVVKMTASGTVEWQKTLWKSCLQRGHSVVQTSDGGYIVASQTGSCFGFCWISQWIIKLDRDGNVLWQKAYGYPGLEGGVGTFSIRQTRDGGYVATGQTSGKALFVLKLDGSGTVQWSKTYRGGGTQWGAAIRQTADDGFIVAGATNSFGAGGYDIWLLKLTPAGAVAWERTYGGGFDDFPGSSIEETQDGGYVLAGTTSSFGRGLTDVWLLKVGATGAIAWQRSYGTTGADTGTGIFSIGAGAYLATGSLSSQGAGLDLFALRVDANGDVPTSCADLRTTYVTPGTLTSTVESTTPSVDTSAATSSPSTATPSPAGLTELEQCASGCLADGRTLCLSQERFQVQVDWRNYNEPGGATYHATAVPLRPDTGYFWFFGDTNVELVVKVLPYASDRFLVMYGALSDVEYWVNVKDTASGRTHQYHNPPHVLASGADSTSFGKPFGAGADDVAGLEEAPWQLAIPDGVAVRPAATAAAAVSCSPSETTLCLSGGRIRIAVDWRNYNEPERPAQHATAVPLRADTGYFWFFADTNVELVIKVLSLGGDRFLVMYGALSDIEYWITLTDTQTQKAYSFHNEAHRLASVASVIGP